MMLRKIAVISIAVAALALVVAPAQADQVASTPAGSTIMGEPVSATADFGISGNTLTITLTNTQANMQDAGQLLTDIFFTLSAPGALSVTGQTGELINVGADGTVTPTGSTTLAWGFGSATVGSLSGFELCTICQGGPSGAPTTPSEGILGPPSADGNYDDGNGSIDANKPHNPFVEGSATFTITGIPTGAVIDDAIFSFSTTPGMNVTGTVPEPGSLLLLGTGLLGLVGFGRRRFQNS